MLGHNSHANKDAFIMRNALVSVPCAWFNRLPVGWIITIETA